MGDSSDNKGNPGRDARTLIRRAMTATLGTLDAEPAGGHGLAPYCSLVLSACGHDGAPILLLSTLARHTANLEHSDAVSLLYDGTRDLDEPLTGPRATVLGAIALTDDAGHRARFLARHPSAMQYADFTDFSFYRVAVREAHLVAGFGRIFDLAGDDVLLPPDSVKNIAEAEKNIVDHMNADHGDAIDAYVRGLAGSDETGWQMAACDPEGADLRHGNTLIRVDFPAIAASVDDVRHMLVEMTQTARNSME